MNSPAPAHATSSPERFRSIVDVHVILRRSDGRILLLERAPGLYGAGRLHLPSGHLEAAEPLHHGATREAWEEVGVRIDPAGLDMVALIHHQQTADHTRIGVFFAATQWHGDPYNKEPDKCAGLSWADPRELPHTTIEYPAEGIRTWVERSVYGVHGW